MDDPGCLRASPDPHHVNRCDRPRTRFHADHCGGRGVPRGSRPQPCLFRRPGLMAARSSRLGHSGPNSPGRRYESSRHGLAASRPRTPGSGAVRFLSPPTKPSSRLGTRHIVRCNAVARSAPLPVRHPGPRVTAAGRYTPATSGLATTASQSGQRHASYHPPRLIMSAARHKMLSTPCRARLRAARHYRSPPTQRQAAEDDFGRFRAAAVVTGMHASRSSRLSRTPPRDRPPRYAQVVGPRPAASGLVAHCLQVQPHIGLAIFACGVLEDPLGGNLVNSRWKVLERVTSGTTALPRM